MVWAPNRPDLEVPHAHRTDNQEVAEGVVVCRSFAGGSESDMRPLAKRLTLILYLAVAGALFVNYLMGLGWFGRHDKIVMWAFLGFAALLGNWLKARAEKRTPVLVEALDAQGAVRSDPRARRFIWQTVSIVGAVTISVILALARPFYACSRCSVMFLNAAQFDANSSVNPNVEAPPAVVTPIRRRR